MAKRYSLDPPQETAGAAVSEAPRTDMDRRISHAYRAQLNETEAALSTLEQERLLARMRQAEHRAPERDRTRERLNASARSHNRQRVVSWAAALACLILIVGIGWRQDWLSHLTNLVGGRAASPAEYDTEDAGMTEAAVQTEASGETQSPELGITVSAGEGSPAETLSPGQSFDTQIVSRGNLTVAELNNLEIDYPAEVLLQPEQSRLTLDFAFTSSQGSTLLIPQATLLSTDLGGATAGTPIRRDFSTAWYAQGTLDAPVEWVEPDALTEEQLTLPFVYRLQLDISGLNPGDYKLVLTMGGTDVTVPLGLRQAVG